MKSKIQSLNSLNFTVDKQIAETTASISFGEPMGSIPDYGLSLSGSYTFPASAAASGIFVYDTALTVGPTQAGRFAGINKATYALYAKYRSANSSLAAYQEMDVGIYTFTSAQLVALIGWMQSIYHTLYMENRYSKYAKEALVAAMGVDPKTIQPMDLAGYIDKRMVDLKGLWIDSSIPLYKYAADMYGHILKDSPNVAKTQYYVSRPNWVMKYVKDGENIGSIEYTQFFPATNTVVTQDQLFALVDDVFDSFFSSSYISNLNAELEKAFTKLGIKSFELEYVKLREAITPEFDEVALTRIKNAIINDFIPGSITQDIIEKTLNQTVATAWSDDSTAQRDRLRFIGGNVIIHTKDAASATPEDVVVLASFAPSMELEIDSTNFRVRQVLTGYQAEIITGARTVTFVDDKSFGYQKFTTLATLDIGTPAEMAAKAISIAKTAKDFDFLPVVKMIYTDPETSVSGYLGVVADWDYSAVVSSRQLRLISSTGIWAILGIPTEH